MQIEDFVEADGYANEELFDCDYSSIDDVINQVIVFTGAIERDTENGLRTLVAFQRDDGQRSAFWTDSKKLKEVVNNPQRTFPFRAIIKVVKLGEMTGFRFFSPNSAVTKEDEDNFSLYQKSKFRYNKRR